MVETLPDKQYSETAYSTQAPLLAFGQLMDEKKKGTMFGYVQCDNENPEQLRNKIAKFPPVFKKKLSSVRMIYVMQNCAEEEGLTSQPRTILISPFSLEDGTD